MTTDIVARSAKNNDILKIQSVLSANISDVSLFQQPLWKIRRDINDFFIAEHEGEVVGCGALHMYSIDIAEIRGVSVLPNYQNRGVGCTILNKCIEIAIAKDIQTVFVFTYKPTYFERYGFKTTSLWSLPISVIINKSPLNLPFFQQPAAHIFYHLRVPATIMKFVQ